jgi:hypothetical protein
MGFLAPFREDDAAPLASVGVGCGNNFGIFILVLRL